MVLGRGVRSVQHGRFGRPRPSQNEGSTRLRAMQADGLGRDRCGFWICLRLAWGGIAFCCLVTYSPSLSCVLLSEGDLLWDVSMLLW